MFVQNTHAVLQPFSGQPVLDSFPLFSFHIPDLSIFLDRPKLLILSLTIPQMLPSTFVIIWVLEQLTCAV